MLHLCFFEQRWTKVTVSFKNSVKEHSQLPTAFLLLPFFFLLFDASWSSCMLDFGLLSRGKQPCRKVTVQCYPVLTMPSVSMCLLITVLKWVLLALLGQSDNFPQYLIFECLLLNLSVCNLWGWMLMGATQGSNSHWECLKVLGFWKTTTFKPWKSFKIS